jgi:hypothetical protein
MIRANITAYSTAVGPSSEARKRCTFKAKFFIGSLQLVRYPHFGQTWKLSVGGDQYFATTDSAARSTRAIPLGTALKPMPEFLLVKFCGRSIQRISSIFPKCHAQRLTILLPNCHNRYDYL